MIIKTPLPKRAIKAEMDIISNVFRSARAALDPVKEKDGKTGE